MSTLLNKANVILAEKTNKIIPENIKSGVEIFDIMGNYIGEGSGPEIDLSTGIKFAHSEFSSFPFDADVGSATSLGMMFAYSMQLTNLDKIRDWNIINATQLQGMFSGCAALTSADLENWDTSNAIYLSSLFQDCYSLYDISGISNWNISKVNTLQAMFSGCSNLLDINLNNWNTSNVEDISSIFGYCSRLSNLNITNWNTSNITSMSAPFAGCSNLVDLDISNWDVSNVRMIDSCFTDCSNLVNIDLSNWNISNAYSIGYMFGGCYNLSNNSLNSILSMCATAVNTDEKTLQTIGLTQDQANICTNLNNWSNAQNAGWSTGYDDESPMY